MIHPTAIIHPDARIDSSVRIGPFAVVDAGVEIGSGCMLGPHVYITGQTRVGPNNVFHAGAVVGDAPQDLRYKGQPTGLKIGSDNVFREHVTIHRSASESGTTVIGSSNFFMASSHVGHDCQIGDGVILANGVLLGGYAVVQDRAFLSGHCLVHQFTRVGTLAMMQGGSAISKDLPPYTMARGQNQICGLNTVGLRRAGISSQHRLELKRLYHALFRGSSNLGDAVASAKSSSTCAAARTMLEFIEASKRGVCSDFSRSGSEQEE